MYIKKLAVYLVVLWQCLLRIEAGAPDTCPNVEDDPEIDILIPHESDCTKFYKCSHGVAVVQQCPDGLYFNPTYNYCDYPANVECVNQPSYHYTKKKLPLKIRVASKDDKVCPEENPEVDVLYPHETNCSLFYKCSWGELVVHECFPGLYFNPILNYCDYPENVNCSNEKYYNKKYSNGGNKDGECPLENPEIDVLLPHESNCSLFYKCDLGEKVVQECPSGLYFNPLQNYCDWPENVDCVNGFILHKIGNYHKKGRKHTSNSIRKHVRLNI